MKYEQLCVNISSLSGYRQAILMYESNDYALTISFPNRVIDRYMKRILNESK